MTLSHRYIFLLLSALLIVFSFADASQKKHRSRPVKADVSVKKISLKEVPAEVKTAFEERFPTAEIKGQLKQVREKVAYYEIQSLDSGKTLDVVFQSDGAIVEIAEAVDEDQLPENIRTAIQEKYPSAAVTGSEMVTRGSHVEYEISLQSGKKTTYVVANLAGKIFTVK